MVKADKCGRRKSGLLRSSHLFPFQDKKIKIYGFHVDSDNVYEGFMKLLHWLPGLIMKFASDYLFYWHFVQNHQKIRKIIICNLIFADLF